MEGKKKKWVKWELGERHRPWKEQTHRVLGLRKTLAIT
jgi:hypothetical protein